MCQDHAECYRYSITYSSHNSLMGRFSVSHFTKKEGDTRIHSWYS